MDVYRDNGEYLRQFVAEHQSSHLEDIIKSGALIDIENAPDEYFAYPEERAFPIVDKGNVATSVIYFLRDPTVVGEENITKVASRLRDACVDNGLQPPEALIKWCNYRPEPDFEKEAEEKKSNQPERLVAIFVQRAPAMDPRTRRMTAMELARLFMSSGTELPEALAPYAGTKINPELYNQLIVRSKIAESKNLPVLAKDLEALAEEIRSDPSVVDDWNLLAETLVNVDKVLGLDGQYGEGILDPYMSVFSCKGFETNLKKKAAQEITQKVQAVDYLTDEAKQLIAQNPEYLNVLPDVLQRAIMEEEIAEPEPLSKQAEASAEDFMEFLSSEYADDLPQNLVEGLSNEPDLLADLPDETRNEIAELFGQYLQDKY